MTDFITCTTCSDKYGCSSVSERALVFVEKLMIHVKSEEIAVGEDVTLECIALKSYTSKIEWQIEDHLKPFFVSGNDPNTIYKCILIDNTGLQKKMTKMPAT